MIPDSSRAKLTGVHPDLVKVVEAVALRKDFIVTCGLRTREEQAKLVAAGKSKTMHSRHLTGHAVDFAPWNDKDRDRKVDGDEISWQMKDFIPIADVFKEEARLLHVAIEWGGDWISFKDGPHIQLNERAYP